MKIPLVGFGTWKLFGTEAYNAVYSALSSGYRHIDCAFIYKNQHFVGKAINDFLNSQSTIKREDLFITSKLWISQTNQVVQAIDATLKELNLDYLDLYLIHWPISYKTSKEYNDYSFNDWFNISEKFEELRVQSMNDKLSQEERLVADKELAKIQNIFYPKQNSLFIFQNFDKLKLQETWKALENLVSCGKTKYIGVSNFSIEQISYILSFCKIKPFCNQVECNPFLRQKEMKKYLEDNEIKMVAYSPLGGNSSKIFGHERIEKIYKDNQRKFSKAQIILGNTLLKGIVVIVKSKSKERQIENLKSLELLPELKDLEWKIIEERELNEDDFRYCYPIKNNEKNKGTERNLNFFNNYVNK